MLIRFYDTFSRNFTCSNRQIELLRCHNEMVKLRDAMAFKSKTIPTSKKKLNSIHIMAGGSCIDADPSHYFIK